MNINKVPPQAIDSEKVILGSIMLEREAIHEVSDLLRPDMFYHAFHQVIFSAMLEMQAKGQTIDMNLLADHLTKKGELEKAGGAAYIMGLTNNVVSSAHNRNHARRITEVFIKREQIRIAGELMVGGYDDTTDAFENQENAERQLHDLGQTVSESETKRIDSVVISVFQNLEKLRHRDQFLIGVTSGHQTLDKITMGWRKSDFIIIAARPAVGKTAFTLSLAVNAAGSGTPAAFFSLEMSSEQLVERILATQAQMYLSTIKGARLSDEQMQHLFTKGVQPVSGLPLYVDDTASMSVAQFKAKLRRLVRRYGVGIAFVDYLQLMKSSVSKQASRQQQIGDISRELKITAKELKIPIIALSQLNRDAENKIPQLSNIREAGDIEQDADIVTFLYGHSEEEIRQDMMLGSRIYYKIAKHRNGKLSTIKFEYDKDYQSFTDLGEGELIALKSALSNSNNPF